MSRTTTETGTRPRSRLRERVLGLGLGFGIWVAGIFTLSPSDDPTGGTGFAVLLQLPLLIYYERTHGLTATGPGGWRGRLKRVLVGFLYAGFVLAALGAILVGTPDRDSVAFFFPTLIVLTGLLSILYRLGDWLRGRIRPRRSNAPEPDPGAPGQMPPQDGDSDGQLAREPVRTEPPADARGDAAEDDAGFLNWRASLSPQDARFGRLAGILLLPIALGWGAGQPQVGISIATLLLAVYEIVYTPDRTA